LSVFFCDLLGSTARSDGGGGGGDGRGGGGGDGVEFGKSKHTALSGVCLLLWKRQYCQATHLSLSFIDSMFE
jgi:hypothetical protein